MGVFDIFRKNKSTPARRLVSTYSGMRIYQIGDVFVGEIVSLVGIKKSPPLSSVADVIRWRHTQAMKR
jgi:hypothetical protein